MDKLDCCGSAAIRVNVSSPADDCWVCRRNAAKPANTSGESPGTSGASPSADGANPAADNNVDASGVCTGSGVDTTRGSSSDAFVVDVVTSTADTASTAGRADTGSDLGCTEEGLSATDWLLPTLLTDGAVAIDRFGFLAVAAAADKSDPDFLSLTVDAGDFLSPSLLSLPFDAFSPVPISLVSRPCPASARPVAPEDSDDPVVPDGADDSLSAPADADESSDEEDDESDDELDESESAGPAHATPGMVATATPTPKATANPPTRPTYLA